jgi:hypothetical protein
MAQVITRTVVRLGALRGHQRVIIPGTLRIIELLHCVWALPIT